ncbi:tRNA threonylcarbamoyladenosine dehydratase [Desulfobotulus sp.]|jgi:tRNA A37 threonylcarbamoyladenosine dehydratase|uniref:tRNA threonylcarbamoyladenosine dehydratase n=1 Tax=Desulfobotulus sp. TaxID=1940337 RepID=UPI002A3674F9|nr:tRNA threonylcarbamoyladenosine dehydratase [Desulfobotulus sp.]MDY0164071.1 tRNA threonylcarbamoyladenosine dehydratase [Desulfobotulus sp.]
MNPAFSRIVQLMGKEAFERLQGARVTICGMGAVGSFAVEALARSGVGHLRLVDFDVVEASNMNRQLFALHSSLGQPKVALAAARVRDIAPGCTVEALNLFIDSDSLPRILDNAPHVVLDAIDGLNSKVMLIREALLQDLYIISSMGAATRYDPGAIQVADISKTHHCPLARMVRRRLHRFGIEKGLVCVFSPEPPQNAEVPVVQRPETQTRGRTRTPLGSLAHVTGSFGLRMAGLALDRILERRPDERDKGGSE